MAKIYGQLEVAQIENKTSDPSGVGLCDGRIWFRTDTDKAMIYTGAVKRELLIQPYSTFTLPASDGSAGQFLKTDGSGILSYAIPDAREFFIAATSKTANYTATSSDNLILCDATSAAFTITLPAAASSSGKIFKIQKIDTSVNLITIDANASETINGALTAKLSTQYEILEICCNGTAWFIVAREYNRATQNGSSTFTFEGVGTPSNIDVRFYRLGDRMFVHGKARAGTVDLTTFAILLPTGITIDSAKLASTTNNQGLGQVHRLALSSQTFAGSSAGPYPLFYDGSTTTKLFAALEAGATVRQFSKSSGTSMFSTGDELSFNFNVPITNWE